MNARHDRPSICSVSITLAGSIYNVSYLHVEMDNFDSHTWGSYFYEIVHLLEAADRQYGIANQSYAQYVLERLEICLQTCRTVRGQITPSGGTGRLQWYLEAFDELISCLQLIRRKWEEYQNIGSPNEALAYCVPVVHTGRRGRPRFDVTKKQLEYLASLSFTWSDIAALLGVSRTTIFRYVAGTNGIMVSWLHTL